jgi:hypothetical protein
MKYDIVLAGVGGQGVLSLAAAIASGAMEEKLQVKQAEVHGMAQTDRQRDRISTSTSWKLVWQDGEELQLKAVALDREFDNNTNQSGWAITDGSAGTTRAGRVTTLFTPPVM